MAAAPVARLTKWTKTLRLEGGGGLQLRVRGIVFAATAVCVAVALCVVRPPMVLRRRKRSYEVQQLCFIRLVIWSVAAGVVAVMVHALG